MSLGLIGKVAGSVTVANKQFSRCLRVTAYLAPKSRDLSDEMKKATGNEYPAGQATFSPYLEQLSTVIEAIRKEKATQVELLSAILEKQNKLKAAAADAFRENLRSAPTPGMSLFMRW